MKVAVVCSQYNEDLVRVIHEQALKVFSSHEVQTDIFFVPGAGEIPQATHWVLTGSKKYDGILALGVLIRGKTIHFDFLADLLEKSLWDLQKNHALPLVFSVLMVESRSQALQRIKKKRGEEVAKTLLEMIELKKRI